MAKNSFLVEVTFKGIIYWIHIQDNMEEDRLERSFSSISQYIWLDHPTSKITIPEKPCGINQTQIDWLRLLTSSSTCKVTSLNIASIPFRPITRVLKIMSIPSMQHSHLLIFILSNIKISIFSTMVLSEMIRFLKYDHPTLYWILSQFHFTWRSNHLALGPKSLVPSSSFTALLKLILIKTEK